MVSPATKYKVINAVSFTLTAIILFVLFLSSCRNDSSKALKSSVASGKILSEKFCQSCHLNPDPSLLDADTWINGVLPAMGPRLGIFEHQFQHYSSSKNDKSLPANFYPATPQLSSSEWQSILNYYGNRAPKQLPIQNRIEITDTNLNQFDIIHPPQKSSNPAALTLVKLHPADNKMQLWTFDVLDKSLNKFDAQLNKIASAQTNALITDLAFGSKQILACNVNVINPNNARYGNLLQVKDDPQNSFKIDTVKLIDSLARPVQILAEDLNKDNLTDYIICEFGNLTGNLSWSEQLPNGLFKRHVLSDLPGAITVHVNDYNKDGLPDIWALFSQGDESIWLYTNKGAGNFDAKRILRFPPSYGSTWFELTDMNADGNLDIVYTCGDNADFSPILKPYHGVYVFNNQGNNLFKESYFFPINGCYKALARDYDKDGDIDIATIAFFADYAQQPDEGFVYLENQGSNKFKPLVSKACREGRWLTMDAGDIDGDGYTDLILGNFSVRPSTTTPIVDWKLGAAFLLLKNKGQGLRK